MESSSGVSVEDVSSSRSLSTCSRFQLPWFHQRSSVRCTKRSQMARTDFISRAGFKRIHWSFFFFPGIIFLWQASQKHSDRIQWTVCLITDTHRLCPSDGSSSSILILPHPSSSSLILPHPSSSILCGWMSRTTTYGSWQLQKAVLGSLSGIYCLINAWWSGWIQFFLLTGVLPVAWTRTRTRFTYVLTSPKSASHLLFYNHFSCDKEKIKKSQIPTL